MTKAKLLIAQIKEMHQFLDIWLKPSTIYKQEHDNSCGYDEWLEQYVQKLKSQCEAKLVAEEMRKIGSCLFKQRFPNLKDCL